jgi:hypothetical protein
MLKPQFVTGLLLGLAAALGVANVAHAATPTGVWHMESTSSMIDSSGNGNNGTTKNITSAAGFFGKGYHFNGSSSIVTVKSSSSLNPGSGNIRLIVHVKFRQVPSKSVGDYDLIRKGLSSTSGGDYKMEIYPNSDRSQAQALCYFRGSAGSGTLQKGPNLTDGKWHTISCYKTASTMQLIVDGTTYTKSVKIGSIANSAPLTIGAKSTGGDWYLGDMDEVSVEIN